MQPATILYMSHTPEDRIYDQEKSLKTMLDRLASHLGEMRQDITEIRTALKGNDFGTEGLVNRVEVLETGLLRVEADVETLKRQAKLNRKILNRAYAAGGALITVLAKWIFDHLIPHKS